MTSDDSALSRRAVLGAVGGGLAVAGGAAAGGFAAGRRSDATATHTGDQRPKPRRIDAHGVHQAGIARPVPRQRHLLLSVLDLRPGVAAAELLADLGRVIVGLAHGEGLSGLAPAGLTITVGVGPRVVRRSSGDRAPGAEELPQFGREEISDRNRGGDLMLQTCSDDPAVVVVADDLIRCEFGSALRLRWQESGFRGAIDDVGARNLLGFHDGVAVPVGDAELNTDVWLGRNEMFAGGTIGVVRRMAIDTRRFGELSPTAQEKVIGRRRDSGAPLSGGGPGTDVDLDAKESDGRYRIPVDAHVRRAHPLPSGADGLMLRRSYSYAHPGADHGLLFISFQRTLRTFTRTLARMDEADALLDFTRTTASGNFLILPGFTRDKALGFDLQ